MLRCAHLWRASATAAAAASSALSAYYGKNFTVAPRTWERIAQKNAEEGFTNDQRFLRLAIDSGGCHGYLYKFSFEPVSELDGAQDILVRESDVATASAAETGGGQQPAPQVVVDRISLTKLENAVLDYHSELKGSAFVVVGNALVDQSCACALSFSIKKKTKAGQPPAQDERAPFLQGSARGKGSAIRRGVH